ncbi:hypothetical protein NCS52_00884000 [Fusarium sp. LHS14.1]|nr:hypothetical protein NCS52_00884000 [Fusarium sp. LHS14.1]
MPTYNDIAHSDAVSDTQGQAPTPDTLENHPVPHHPAIPLIGARALRRESRGPQVAIDVLSNRGAQSRLTSFRVDASVDTISDVQQPGLSMRLLDFVSPPFASRLAAGFSAANISKFELVLSNGRDGSAGQAILDHGLVGSVLASMPGLTELSIEGHNLGIIGAIPDGSRRHANTLKQLTIAYCSLDDLDPSWEDVVEDINLLQGTGRASLDNMSLVLAYSSVLFTGCGRNKTKSRPPSDEEVYSFSLGVDETLVLCPSLDLGHQTP